MNTSELRLKKSDYYTVWKKEGEITIQKRTGEVFEIGCHMYGICREDHVGLERKYDYVITDLCSGYKVITAGRKREALELLLSDDMQSNLTKRIYTGKTYRGLVEKFRKMYAEAGHEDELPPHVEAKSDVYTGD